MPKIPHCGTIFILQIFLSLEFVQNTNSSQVFTDLHFNGFLPKLLKGGDLLFLPPNMPSFSNYLLNFLVEMKWNI